MTRLQRLRLNTGKLWAGGALLALMAQGMDLPVASLLVSPSVAQEAAPNPEARLRKIEGELRAVQRKVFPGADPKMFPQEPPAPVVVTPAPNASALTDVLMRLEAVEAQNARLTAQVEDLNHRLTQLTAPKAETAETLVPTADGGMAVAPANGPSNAPVQVPAQPVAAPPAPKPVAQPAPQPAPKPVATKPAKAEAVKAEPAPVANAKPPASRVAAVKGIVKPQTSDPAEDDYSYGFKLYEAKFYPEAEQQLKLYLEANPKHKSVSRARNLIGRSYLDEGKPREAATWFLQNYQANKKGERAADSLLNLAAAMIEMKDTNRACIAIAEFADGYAVEAAGRLKAQFDATRKSVKCN
jgi:TolA-binding protein